VGSIGFGRAKDIGKTLAGTTPGIIDYSTKEIDTFGEYVIIQREFAATITFNVGFRTSAYRSISRTLEKLRTTPAIYYADENLTKDLIVLGFYRDFSPALGVAYTFASIEIIGVI